MFKTILLLSTVFLLGGYMDTEAIVDSSRELAEKCKGPVSVKLHFGRGLTSVEVECVDMDLSFFNSEA